METHVATCHGGKVENVEGQIDPLLGEEDVFEGEEKKEVVRRRRKGGTGGKEGKHLQCSHCQLQLDTIGELRTHVKVICHDICINQFNPSEVLGIIPKN